MPSPVIYRQWAREFLTRAEATPARDRKTKYLSLAVRNTMCAQQAEAEEAESGAVFREAELYRAVVRARPIGWLPAKIERGDAAPRTSSGEHPRNERLVVQMRIARGRSHIAMLDKHINQGRQRGASTHLAEDLKTTIEASVHLMEDYLQMAA